MKSANEMLKLRDEKYKNWLDTDKKIKGQWDLIESRVSSYNIGHSSRYISIGNVGDLYKENEKKLIDLGYKIVVTKAETRLYFDNKAYDDYLMSDKVRSGIERSNKYINSKQKENLKNNTTKQVDEGNKLKSEKETDTMSEYEYRDVITEFMKALNDNKLIGWC